MRTTRWSSSSPKPAVMLVGVPKNWAFMPSWLAMLMSMSSSRWAGVPAAWSAAPSSVMKASREAMTAGGGGGGPTALACWVSGGRLVIAGGR